jgi:hypothetical protein
MMPALLLTLFGPNALFKLAAIAAGLVALVIAYGIWHHKVYKEGWNDHEAAIIRQDKKAIAAALAKRGALNECVARGMRWEQSTGECVGR